MIIKGSQRTIKIGNFLFFEVENKNIPIKAGVYLLVNKNGYLEYIGQSFFIQNRLNNHHRFTPDRHRIFVMEIKDEKQRLKTEGSLILRLQPALNQQGKYPFNTAKKATDSSVCDFHKQFFSTLFSGSFEKED